ncbi:MAG: hypothetical protein ACQEUZ_06350 [Pseudomonadota bacterium]
MADFRMIFRDLPGPADECVFVELEDAEGRSVDGVGEWSRRPDGYAEFRLYLISELCEAVEAALSSCLLRAMSEREPVYPDYYEGESCEELERRAKAALAKARGEPS